MKRWLAILLVWACLPLGLAATGNSDPLWQLAQRLAASVKAEPLAVVVGNFVYQDTFAQCGVSDALQRRFEETLPKTHKFRLVARTNCLETAAKSGLQMRALDPGAPVRGARPEEVGAVLRGRYYDHGDKILVKAELQRSNADKPEWLEAEVSREQLTSSSVAPSRLPESQAAVREITSLLGAMEITNQFDLVFRTSSGKRGFAEGESIQFEVASPVDCWLAILTFTAQSDRLLFPNGYHTNCQVRAHSPVSIPPAQGAQFRLEAEKPFGTDIVVAIACTGYSELHQKLTEWLRKDSGTPGYLALSDEGSRPVARSEMLPRGIGVKPARKSATSMEVQPARWSQATLLLNTYPAPSPRPAP